MQSGAVLLVLLTLTVPLAGCIGTDDPLDADSRADPPPADAGNLTAFTGVQTPEEIREQLQAYDRLSAVEVETIGESFEGRPIDLATLGEGPFELWIVGRQHGDEPTGGEAILLAIEALADPQARLPADAPPVVHALREHRTHLLDALTFLFVPVANPDGAAAYQRTTAMEQDPNRDHYLFTQPSTTALREAFWDHRPDACLDLHNEGMGQTGFDAFGPTGPMLEAEPEALMLRNADLVVREVDAAGGNAGSFNENYRAPEPADEHPNPTAAHPGTHDMFCTARGAPGWTPEGAIHAGDNGVFDPVFNWSTTTHLVTIAASSLHWAGAYDATETTVWKTSGETGLDTQHEVEIDEATTARFQAVWRQTTTAGDHNPLPARFTVTTPDGTTLDARTPGPERWTSTVQLDDAQPGTYQLTLAAPPGGTYELRTYTQPESTPLVEVERDAAGLAVHASPDAPGPIEASVTDVADPIDATLDDPALRDADTVRRINSTATERTRLAWHVELDPGQTVHLATPEAWENAGPYRFTVTSGEDLHTGVEDAENPAPD